MSRLSEEEKKAIEIVKNIEEKDLLDCWDQGEEEYKSIQILLNLIEKQQAELDKEKEKNKELTDIIEAIEEFKRLKRPVMDLVHEMQKFEDDFISKDKIRELLQDKIRYRQFELQQEYKDFKDDIKLNILQDLKEELLEE